MKSIKKLEFGVATGLFLFCLLTSLSNSAFTNVFSARHSVGYKFEQYNQVFDYYIHYLIPVVVHILVSYTAFLVVHFVIVPMFLERSRFILGGLLLIPVMLYVFFLIMVADSYYFGYLFGVFKTVRGAHMFFAKRAFNTTFLYGVLYTVYYCLRWLGITYLTPMLRRNAGMRKIVREAVPIAIFWVVVFVFSVNDMTNNPLAMELAIFGPYLGGCYFLWMYRAMPEYHGPKDRGTFALTTLLYSIPAMVLSAMFFGHTLEIRGHIIGPLAVIAVLLQFAALLPLTWRLYQLRKKRETEMGSLELALGKSNANLDFLRSQINPHFLFNALNTLYGTALVENAPHTSEGIQRLGDMMRFMLHENAQDKIALTKEVAYLQNYISLQRLRTQSSPDIQIDVNMNELHCNMEIPPMLLIPFVENAFKHGISLRTRSRISVSLYCDNGKLFFDVYNSVHDRPENDPEKEGFGIGLTNVKDRLNLLYPNRHELSIRKTATEFFVHLTIDVNPEKTVN